MYNGPCALTLLKLKGKNCSFSSSNLNAPFPDDPPDA